MSFVFAAAFWICVFLLLYTYAGYPALLALLQGSSKSSDSYRDQGPIDSPISVVVLAHNESSVIERRISNILAQDASIGEVIIGSDGSTDDTAQLASNYPDSRVRVLEFPNQRGRALVTNDCVSAAAHGIIVFTDAETHFRPGFVYAISQPFIDPKVGVAVGRLLWRDGGRERAGLYWALELSLRSLESRLGLLATASGPGMAIRKSCFEPLLPDEDVDFSTPICAMRKGFKVVYTTEAVASDATSPSAAAEFRARTRMVTKNMAGTLRELRKVNVMSRPGLWWSIVSHKLLRWMTPLFVIGIPFAVWGPATAALRPIVFGLYGTVGAAVALGAAASRRGRRIPLATHAWSLAVVNAGMLAGLFQAGLGRRISTY